MPLGQDERRDVDDEAEHEGRDGDQAGPEVVVDRRGILHPEDEDVPGEHDAVQEQDDLRLEDVAEHEQEEAGGHVEGAEVEIKQVEGVKDGRRHDEGPAEEGLQLAQQGYRLVGSVAGVLNKLTHYTSLNGAY